MEIIKFSSKELPIDKPDMYATFSTKKMEEIQKLQQIYEEKKDFETIDDLKFGVLDYLHYYTGLFKTPERERKKMIINKGSLILRTCLDIKYIVQKFYEIEKLKQILLTEMEIEKFANLPKPEIQVMLDPGDKKRGTIVTNVFAKQVNMTKELSDSKEKLIKTINLKTKSKLAMSKR